MIRRGDDWGEAGVLSKDSPVAESDADLASAFRAQFEAGQPMEAGLIVGDLHKTLGNPDRAATDLYSGHGMRLPIDVWVVRIADNHGDASTEETEHFLVAHLEALSSRHRFQGPTLLAMNAAFVGSANLGPKAHPGDGLIDVTVGELDRQDRARSKKRSVTGSHIPHPDLKVSRVKRLDPVPVIWRDVRIDGVSIGAAEVLEIRRLEQPATVVV